MRWSGQRTNLTLTIIATELSHLAPQWNERRRRVSNRIAPIVGLLLLDQSGLYAPSAVEGWRSKHHAISDARRMSRIEA